MIGGGARAMLQHGLDATGGYDAETLDRLHRCCSTIMKPT